MSDVVLMAAIHERRGDMDTRFLEVRFEFRPNGPSGPHFRPPDYLGAGERDQHFYALVAALEAWADSMGYGVEWEDAL